MDYERRVLREQLRKQMNGIPQSPGAGNPKSGAVPVVGRPQVCGSKVKNNVKVLTRPPHDIPPATWHLNPDLDKMEGKGPLTREQLERFHEDGYLFIPEFYSEEALEVCFALVFSLSLMPACLSLSLSLSLLPVNRRCEKT